MLLNAFSANMLVDLPSTVTFTDIFAHEARNLLLAESDGEEEVRSAVGHADTAAVFSAVLGLAVPCRRETVRLASGDSAIIGQYFGPRLPEGATALPAGATIRWLKVSVA